MRRYSVCFDISTLGKTVYVHWPRGSSQTKCATENFGTGWGRTTCTERITTHEKLFFFLRAVAAVGAWLPDLQAVGYPFQRSSKSTTYYRDVFPGTKSGSVLLNREYLNKYLIDCFIVSLAFEWLTTVDVSQLPGAEASRDNLKGISHLRALTGAQPIRGQGPGFHFIPSCFAPLGHYIIRGFPQGGSKVSGVRSHSKLGAVRHVVFCLRHPGTREKCAMGKVGSASRHTKWWCVPRSGCGFGVARCLSQSAKRLFWSLVNRTGHRPAVGIRR